LQVHLHAAVVKKEVRRLTSCPQSTLHCYRHKYAQAADCLALKVCRAISLLPLAKIVAPLCHSPSPAQEKHVLKAKALAALAARPRDTLRLQRILKDLPRFHGYKTLKVQVHAAVSGR